MHKTTYSKNITIYTATDYAVVEYNTMLTSGEKAEVRKHILNTSTKINNVFFRQYKIDRWKTKKA